MNPDFITRVRVTDKEIPSDPECEGFSGVYGLRTLGAKNNRVLVRLDTFEAMEYIKLSSMEARKLSKLECLIHSISPYTPSPEYGEDFLAPVMVPRKGFGALRIDSMIVKHLEGGLWVAQAKVFIIWDTYATFSRNRFI